MDIEDLIQKGKYKSLKRRLEKDKDIDINSMELYLEPILFFVLQQDMYEIAHLLIDYGYDVTKLDSDGKSLPMQTDNVELIKKMLDLGANINVKDTLFHETLLSNALRDNDIQLAHYLLEKGANLEDVEWKSFSIKYKEPMIAFKNSLEEKKKLEASFLQNENTSIESHAKKHKI
jgi:ankyrin repeat protein